MDTGVAIHLLVMGIIKPSLLLLVILLLWIFVRNRSAALQHFVLSLGFVGILLLPLLASLTPIIPLRIESFWGSSAWFFFDLLVQASAWLESELSSSQWLIVAACYLLPATSMLFYLLLGVIGLWRQLACAQKVTDAKLLAQVTALVELVDVNRPIRLFIAKDIDSPRTWGVFNPVILLPRAALLWDEDKQLSVLMHELGHIARWDWLVSLVVKITCAIFWFLLPIWWLAYRLYQQAEIACDDYIYKLRDKHLVYAQNLLAIAAAQTHHPIDDGSLQMRGHSAIHQRIMAVLDKQRPHHPVALESAQYWVLVSGLVLVVFSGLQWMPLQAQMNASAAQQLIIQWQQQQELLPTSTESRSELFSWALVQSLKPASTPAPEPIELIEQLQVVGVKPDKAELAALERVALTNNQSLSVPRIQIEGYLPLKLVTPEYPQIALNRGIEGWVQVEFTIDTTGFIINPHIVAHSPSGIFDRSVLQALRKSYYRPQLFDGQPIVVQGVTELFRFTLQHDVPPHAHSFSDVAPRRR
ncbi:hypothetical protein CBP51_13860 [Cellvibrio mixtus]|uniref:Protein TonB n=1 Tax=Cellvibrio mixtus TaxID=39650 RepID=A0A266Q3U8_9GAMM|nr:M56 family metallopeptidase [Cellvibrio mixtus]OZY84296.1 hypothetical protein CBP51_13860 [Cellvibrio mixtus]